MRNEQDKQIFKQNYPDRSHALIIDLEQTDRIDDIVDEIQKIYGRIDILVNNAGYGLWGLVEEVSESEVRRQIDVNFIAAWKLVQAVLPIMRKQKSGHIIQVSSRLGIIAGPGGGVYAAGKFALEGLSEALAAEVDAFGIKVTLAEPGPMRTAFLGRSVNYAKQELKEYYAGVGNVRQKSSQMHGNQPGDPAKVAREIIRIAKLDNPPLRLPLTRASIDALEQKIENYEQTIANWKQEATRVAIQD